MTDGERAIIATLAQVDSSLRDIAIALTIIAQVCAEETEKRNEQRT